MTSSNPKIILSFILYNFCKNLGFTASACDNVLYLEIVNCQFAEIANI